MCDRQIMGALRRTRRRRGRPKETWERTVEKEMKEQGWTWGYLDRCTADRPRWRALVAALCALPREEDEISKSEEPREWVPHVSHKLQKAQQQSVAGRF